MNNAFPNGAGRKLSERAAAYNSSFASAFKRDCEGRPYHAGTVFSINLGGQPILVTAAHVLEKDPKNPCDQENSIYLSKVDGRISENLPAWNTAKISLPTGSLDLALITPVGWNLADHIVGSIPFEKIFREKPSGDFYIAACGFPDSKNKRNGRLLSNAPFAYFGRVASDSVTQRAGYDPEYYFSISIDLKRTYDSLRNLKEVKAPSPYGISGGPAFITHDFSGNLDDTTLLAGMVVAKDREGKSLICVRSDVLLDSALQLLQTLVGSTKSAHLPSKDAGSAQGLGAALGDADP